MYLYGASGHAKVIIDILQAQGVKIDALFDDDSTINDLLSIPVRHEWNGESPVIVSVGNNVYRKQIADRLDCEFGTAIHPSAMVSPFSSIGGGTVVMQGAIVQSNASIGKHCIVNTGATIDHECVLSDYVHVSPQATLCGNVHVGEGAWIGASAVVIPGVKIGRWSVIGAGSVVLHDIPDGVMAYGNPCLVKAVNTNLGLDVKCPQCISQRRIAIYGAGGLGREVAGGIKRINSARGEKWDMIGFYDDSKQVGTPVSHYGEVLGGMDDLNAVQEPLALAIAVGDPLSRQQIFERIKNPNITFPNLVAPSFKVLDDKTYTIGYGNIIQDGCSATCDVVVGNFNVLNGSNVLGHDVTIGDFNVLMPGVRLSGSVTMGDCNLMGVDSVVLQKVQVGSHVTLGAGSVLMTKPKDGMTYIGVPAKKFDFK